MERLHLGYPSLRNDVTRDLLTASGYIEAFGLGIPRKIIAGMHDHNGAESDLIEEEGRSTVRLRKERQPTPGDRRQGKQDVER